MKGGQREGKFHKVVEKEHGQGKLHKVVEKEHGQDILHNVVEKEHGQPEKVISLYLAEFLNLMYS